MFCFVFSVFPDECYQYRPPLPLGCLLSLWYGSGCVEAGHGFPVKLSRRDLAKLQNMNLRQARCCWYLAVKVDSSDAEKT